MSEPLSYHWLQKLLHWLVALLVLYQIPVGIIIINFDNKPVLDGMFGKGSFDTIYYLHKNFGLTLLMLMALRLLVRAFMGKPRYYPELTDFERVASTIVHWALYVLLIVTPIIGWIGISAFPALPDYFGLFKVPGIWAPDREFSLQILGVHRILGLSIAALAILHILAALYHGLIKRDGVFSRMTR